MFVHPDIEQVVQKTFDRFTGIDFLDANLHDINDTSLFVTNLKFVLPTPVVGFRVPSDFCQTWPIRFIVNHLPVRVTFSVELGERGLNSVSHVVVLQVFTHVLVYIRIVAVLFRVFNLDVSLSTEFFIQRVQSLCLTAAPAPLLGKFGTCTFGPGDKFENFDFLRENVPN
jgi:hypothetical protein